MVVSLVELSRYINESFGYRIFSRKLLVGLMKGDSFSELHSEKINDTAFSLPIIKKNN